MNRRRSSRLAVLFGFLIFGSLGWVMLNSGSLREYAPEKHRESIHMVQLDLRGDLLQDHVVVQETLSHHTTEALPLKETQMAWWEMNYCCDDPNLFAQGEERVQIFQWWGNFVFANARSQSEFFASLVKAGQVEINQIQKEDGILFGIASAEFSIPGHEQGKVQIQNFAFNLRWNVV